jgi:anti-sigma regulatory factor (Ser/Thr protein kinase)
MHSPFNRTPPPPLGALRKLRYYRSYIGIASSVSAARDDLRACAQGSGLDEDVLGSALVCLSELATNAVVHAPNDLMHHFRVDVSVRGARQRVLRLAVYDYHRTYPVIPPPLAAWDRLDQMDDDALGGRGLAIVSCLSYRTGVEPAVIGKTVWCELKLMPAHANGGPSVSSSDRAAAGVCGTGEPQSTA